MSAQPLVWNTACDQHLLALYKSQTQATKPLLAYTGTLHTLVGMGSAALATAVALITHVRRPNFPHKGSKIKSTKIKSQ